jgi:hypothetical protein
MSISASISTPRTKAIAEYLYLNWRYRIAKSSHVDPTTGCVRMVRKSRHGGEIWYIPRDIAAPISTPRTKQIAEYLYLNWRY